MVESLLKVVGQGCLNLFQLLFLWILVLVDLVVPCQELVFHCFLTSVPCILKVQGRSYSNLLL